MKAIFIAKEHNNETIGIVFAESQKLASAFFHGKDEYPHHYDIVELNALDNHPTGVIPLATTTKEALANYDYGRVIETRC